jgi:DnaK suppressor protein
MDEEQSDFERRMREALERRLDELGARAVAGRRAGAADTTVRDELGDDADQSERDQPRDLVLRMSERDAALAQQIEAALARMDAGQYGICIECGQRIDPRRLELVPWTPLCAEDAERLERERAPAHTTL